MGLNFAVIGVGGFIAPKHLEAIKNVGGVVKAAYDCSDSVGILDKYDFDTEFFVTESSFIKYLSRSDIDYVSVCSPNYMHYEHCAIAVNNGANVICEKPLAISAKKLNHMQELERNSGKRIYTVMQLRYNTDLLEAKDKLKDFSDVQVVYNTPRGRWYYSSWKSNTKKSGGIAMNIGVHLFDLLIWMFGKCGDMDILSTNEEHIMGTLAMEKANVFFTLSISSKNKPARHIWIDGDRIDFTHSMDMHTKVYQEILAGRGLGISDALPSILLSSQITKEAKRYG